MDQSTPRVESLLLSFELGNNKWLLTFGTGSQNSRRVEIDAGDLNALDAQIALARKKFKLGAEAPLHSCYEAGRDGFWLHRALLARGAKNVVIDSSSIEVNRRKRRAKSDRLDGEALLGLLVRYLNGERRHMHVLRVPDEKNEDARRPHRELERLTKERTAHYNRISSLLVLEGIKLKPGSGFLEALEKARRWDGSPLGENLLAEIRHELERIDLVNKQIKELRKEQDARLEKNPRTAENKKVAVLRNLKGISRSAYALVFEFFGWRTFANRREVGAAAGLVGTPYQSGDSAHEQGISKAGNVRIRTLMVELAWCWRRYQPQSKLTKWFEERFGGGGGRMRRIGIVALGRRLLVALWRFVEHGELPEGAELKSAA
jgi:transposase